LIYLFSALKDLSLCRGD